MTGPAFLSIWRKTQVNYQASGKLFTLVNNYLPQILTNKKNIGKRQKRTNAGAAEID
jgi:hypothetical protein